MNITFLIGNGFDINLGLATTYSDFVKEYKKIETDSEILNNFKKYIKDNQKLWSDAEIAMGQYTSQFEKGKGQNFSKCHGDFCKELAEYLKEQQTRIDFEAYESNIIKSFSRLNEFEKNFPQQTKGAIKTIKQQYLKEKRIFNFICFNYTDTLDKCLAIVKKKPDVLGKHRVLPEGYPHEVGEVCHIHGTVKGSMIFGVNDESQIAKPEIFDFEDGDIDKEMIIKIQANDRCLEDRDSIAEKTIKKSQVLYIYGMSIGETDKLWWKRLVSWLAESDGRQLIIQKYGLIEKDIVGTEYRKQERKIKRKILQYTSFSEEFSKQLEKRIYIDNENLFSEISTIAGAKKSVVEERIRALTEDVESVG